MVKLKSTKFLKFRKSPFNVLKDKKGELLLESVISILIFGILMMAVTLMITSSFQMTTTSMLEANAQQQIVNNLVNQNYNGTTTNTTMYFVSTNDDNRVGVSIECILNNEAGYVAYYAPNIGGGTP